MNGDAPKITAFPVDQLQDEPETRATLHMISSGLARPGPALSRSLAMEILRLWGDEHWNEY